MSAATKNAFSPSAEMMRHGLSDGLIFAAFLFAGMVWVVFPYVTGDLVPGDIGDARLNRFILEHFFQVVTGGAERFTEAPLFYPWIDTIALGDTNWGTAPVYALLRLSSFDPEHAFAGWFALGFVLNYLCAYVVFRLLALQSLGAAAGAFLFSFGLPVIAQDSHAQLLYRFCVPWAVWALYRYLDTRDARVSALIAVLVAFQLLLSFYIGVFLALLLAAYVVVIVLERRPFASKAALLDTLRSLTPELPRGRGPVVTTAALTFAAVAILLLVAAPYLQAVYLYHLGRHWPEIVTMLPRPFSYLRADRSHLWSWMSAHLNRVPMVHEHQIFFGLVPIACLGIVLVSWRLRAADRLMRQSLYALAILILLTLNLGGVSLYAWLAPLPGLSAIRAVTRIVLVMIFPVALIMGRLLDLSWAARSRRPYLGAVALSTCLLLVIEAALIDRSTSTIQQWNQRLEALRAETPALIGADNIIVVADQRADPNWMREIDAMLLAQSLKAKTMNGYSGNAPPNWTPMETCSDIVRVIQAGEAFRKRHSDPNFKADISRIVPIGFGDCSGTFARLGGYPPPPQ